MPQPSYSGADGYINETFFTIFFDIALDTAHPPPLSAFEAEVNGTPATISAIELSTTDNSIKVTFASTTFFAGDIIDFVYTDPTISNDLNAVQGLDGTDTASFSHGTIVAITRPGPSAPPTPTLDAASDSGTLSDFVTNDNTPTVNGTAEANATVKLYDTDGSTLLGTTKADGGGKWSITSGQLGDGSHTLKVTQTDGQNQTSNLSNGLTLSIDTVANAPTSMAVSAGSDSGTLGDGISNSGTPQITGKGEIGAKVSLYDTDGSTVLGTATVDGSGKWSITSSTLVEGSHTLTTKQTDVAGNVSKASSDFTYIMDTVGPTKFALGSNSVQQTKATNGATITSLNSTDLTSVTYGFAVGNGVIDADNGKFTVSGSNLVAAQNLSSGTYHIYMSATDAAGNGAYQIFTVSVVSGPSVSSIVRVGGAATPASTTSVDYTVTFSESVTGVDASDFTLTPGGSASGKISNITGSGSTYTVTVDTLAGDGTLRLDLNSSGTGIKNGTNDGILSGYTSGETYSLDHTAPDAPSTPAMTAGTDTGVSSSDAITKTTTPVFTGTSEANATVNLYDTDGTTLLGTTTADGSGKWSITSSKLSDGDHTVTVKATDAAGNVSKASSSLAAKIDTTAPSAPASPTLSPGSDSGTAGDFLTNVSTPVITGTSEANAIVKLYDTDGSTLLGTTTADGSGKWSITSSTLTDGSHSLTVKQTDQAGNVSTASSSLTLDIDTATPSTPGTPALKAASDSGTLGDGITSISAPTFVGTGTVGDTVTLYDTDGSTVLGTAVVDGSGNWSVAASTLAEGVHTVTVKQTNAAGTASSASKGFAATIDTTAPSAPSAPSMTAGTDTGVSSSDAITSNTTPVFTGTTEANAVVKLYDTDGTTLLGTTTADGSGKWSITSSKLSDGDHTVTVKATDAAGNVSKASSSLAAKIDTTAPSAPASPTLSPGSDSGTAGDFLTNVSTPVITGTSEANAIVKLYDTDGSTLLGTTTADGSGKWSITSSTLTDGSHSLTVKQTDQAGNVSTASSSLTLDIDTSVPTSPSAPSMTAGTDTGASSKDSITSNTTPTFTGTGTKGDTVTLYDTDGTTVLGTATVDGSGNWSITASKLGEGVHTLTTKTTNVAGTASAASKSLSATIDTTAPTTTASTVTFSNDTGSSTTDFITKTASQTVSGKLSANLASDETVKVSMDNGTTWLDATATVGQDTYSLTGLTLVGANTLKIAVVDTAGNQSKLTSQAYALDTNGPTTATLTLSKFHFNSGSSGTLTVSFSEKVTGVDVGDFKVGNGTLDTLTTADDGLTWTGKYTPNTPINAVANVISIDLAGVADAAGNAGSGTASSTSFSIDTFPASTPPSVVDGVPVDTKSSTNTDGSTTTTVTITPVSGGRQDTDPTSAQADIPLARTETGEALVSVGLPEGVGVTSTATIGTNLSLEQRLVNASQPRVELPADFAQILTQGIQAYVPTVGDESQVTVRTLTLTTGSSGGTGSTAPAQPIVISGATGTGEADAAHPQRQEALVIDARTLPAGTVLDLRNVEFAIVIGPSRLVGGSGANVVVGDGSQQFIVLGPEDDVLRGGAGDDTVGSKGGNDKLYGDEGNDWVVGGAGNDQLEGGSGNDILQGGQSDAGTWTFTLNNEGTLVSQFLAKDGNLAESWSLLHTGSWAGADGSRTSDDRLAFSYESNQTLKTIASLYNTMKGHLPTVDELNQWSSAGAGTVKALAAALYSDYRAAHSEIASQSLSTQVQSLVAQVWGASNVTQEIINTGVAYITRGGSWEDGLVWLAQQSQATARYTDASGNLALAQSLVVNETGWSSDTGSDTLLGGEGNDLLVGGRGNDWLDGGAGLDMAVYSGRITDYTFHQQMVSGVLQTIVTNRYTGEVDTLIGIEYGQVGSKYYGLGMNANGLPPLGQEVAMADYVMEFSRADIALMGIPGV